MKDLLEYIINNLVSKPEQVKINEERVEGIINLNLQVDPTDMGIVIGKMGQTIRAIRRLLITGSMSDGNNNRVNLNLLESEV